MRRLKKNMKYYYLCNNGGKNNDFDKDNHKLNCTDTKRVIIQMLLVVITGI